MPSRAPSPTGPPRIERLAPADLAAVQRLQSEAVATVPSGHLWPKTDDELQRHLDGTVGAAYGVFDGERRLEAFALLYLPPAHQEPSPMPFPRVPPEDWPGAAAFVSNAVVAPPARGRGYQGALFDVRVAHARRAGMRWLCAGVHLGNAVSWTNLLRKGMAITGIRSDPGYPIVGLLLPLATPPFETLADERVAVPALDAARHEAVLQDGYIGVRRAPEGAVIYERLRDGG